MTDWFRSWHGAPGDHKWIGVARLSGVPPVVVVGVVWTLLDHASQAEERGSVADFDFPGWADYFGLDEQQLRAIYAALEQRGFIFAGRIAKWERRQPKREDSSAPRQAALRGKGKEQELPLEEPPPKATARIAQAQKIADMPITIEADPPAVDPAPEASADGALISPEAIKLANEVAVIAGHDLQFVPPAWCGAAYRVQAWITNGWKPDLIRESARAQMARKRDGPPDRIQYFEPGIARAHAQAAAPIPIAVVNGAKPHGSGSGKRTVQQASRDLASRVAAAAGEPDPWSGILLGDRGDATGGTLARLLPPGGSGGP